MAASAVAATAAAASARAAPRVLVVGGGPVGMAAAFLLERLYAVPVRVVERQRQPTAHPQAHFLNLRTMEVLYATMPGFHDRLLQHAAPSDLWRDYVYCTGGGRGREFARVDQFGPCIPRTAAGGRDELRRALAPLSPTHFLHFPQNRFEELLEEFLNEEGVHVDRGVELQGLQLTDADGPTRVALRHLGSNEEEVADFDVVIAADGAHSSVRELCGIGMAGTRNLQTIANVHFTSRALSEAARENPAMLYFVFNQDVIGILIAHDLAKGEWVFQIPFFPPQESIEADFSVAQCEQLVRHILPKGAAASDVKILSVGQWRMGARVAKQYDARGRVFLVGDAAHQFPPAGGFGMNTGLQDAHNLAWKLALSLQSPALAAQPETLGVPDLLGSYGRERQHVAKVNTQFALRNVERTMKVPSALNVSHHNAKLLATLVNSAPLKLLPLRAQREFVQRVMALGKLPLGMLDADGGALRDHMRGQVQRLVESRKSLGMLFYHFDIGFSYNMTEWASRAKQLMQDSALDQSVLFRSTIASDDDGADDVVFAPAFRVGERFPHMSLKDASGQRLSSLDLTRLASLDASNADRKVQFVLVADAQDAARVTTSGLIPEQEMVHVAVAVLNATAEQKEAITAAADGFRSIAHFTLDGDDAASSWAAFVASYSAALVRPDGHVGRLWSRE